MLINSTGFRDHHKQDFSVAAKSKSKFNYQYIILLTLKTDRLQYSHIVTLPQQRREFVTSENYFLILNTFHAHRGLFFMNSHFGSNCIILIQILIIESYFELRRQEFGNLMYL